MIRGWCPGVHEPMASGDGLLIRVKPPGGWLDPDRLRAVTAASRLGNGIVELTGRGHLQLRGMTDPTGAAQLLVAAGLAEPDPERETRRNVIAVPPCDAMLVTAAEELLMATPGLAPKFCVAIGGGRGDIVIRDGWIIVAERAIAAPLELSEMRAVLSRLVRLAGGQRLRTPPDDFTQPAPPSSDNTADLAALPFGQIHADTLGRLAELVRLARTTPWRGLVLEPMPPVAELKAIGFLTAANDPLRTLVACIGAPGCASATVTTRSDAGILAALGIRGVHVSGCAKGCASQAPRPTLVGQEGRYGLVRHGRSGDTPDVAGLTIHQAAALLV